MQMIYWSLLAACFLQSPDDKKENPILENLLETGVTMTGGFVAKLPPPSLVDGLSADEQRDVLKKITANERPLADFIKKGVNAPYVLKILSLKDDGKETTARRVDLWFVAYGDLEVLADEDLVKKEAEDEAKESTDEAKKNKADELPSESKVIEAADLEKMNISPTSRDLDERYVFTTFPLFEMVQVSGTSRAIQQKFDDSILITMVMDHRFDKDEQFANKWVSIKRGQGGKLSLDDKDHAYASSGMFGKITRLTEPKGALLVEFHIVFDEPEGWFGGKNVLRSKLTHAAQDGVRKFRRRLDKATKEKGKKSAKEKAA